MHGILVESSEVKVKTRMEEESQQKRAPTSPVEELTVAQGRLGLNGEGGSFARTHKVVQEVKKQLWLAGPMILVSLLQYGLQIISLMFVGHLGKLSLSGAALATSFASVTGFTLLLGMASALDTFCGQSYGARQYQMLGTHMQRAMFVLLLASIPLSIIWAYTGEILKLVGQDYEISAEAGQYARYMIPSIFAYGILQCLTKFLQTQNIVFPMMLTSAMTVAIHILLCWIMAFKFGLGAKGVALASSVSYWINVLLMAMYVKFSSTCANTWNGFSKEAFCNIFTFLRLAVPSALMVCLELWSFLMLVILAGFLPDPELETSVLSICFNTAAVVWMIPYGLSCAVSTRVSNELGAGHPKAARLSVHIVLVMAITEGIVVGCVMILIRNVWGYAYIKQIEVVKYVATMMPILAASNFLDGLQCVLSGTARGCGWQKIGAIINLGSYYFIGIPCAVLLAFVFHIGGKGLWLGMICALFIQVISLSTKLILTSWDEEAKKAMERVQISTTRVESDS